MNKKGIIILIVFLSIICILMTSGFIYLLSSNFEWGSINLNFNESELVDSIEYENEITSLNVDTKSIDVYFEESDNDKYSVEIYSNNKKIDYSFTNEDGVMNVKAYNKTKDNIFIGFGAHGKVVIKIPRNNTIEEFRIDQKIGDIKIGKFENLNGTIINSIGDLDIDTLNNVKIELDTGDIKIERVNNVDIKHTTGDLDIDTANEVIDNSNTGDIDINTINSHFNIASHTGDITINTASLTGDSVINHKTGDIRIKKLTGVYVETDSKIGDVKINNNDRYAEHTLKITNKTGDIRIN